MQRAQLGMVRYADAADARKRLREGTDDEVDVLQHALVLGAAAPRRAVGAQRMRFVDQEVRVVRATDLDDLAQRCDVAADRIEAFDDHQTVAIAARQALELLSQTLR